MEGRHSTRILIANNKKAALAARLAGSVDQ